MAVIDSLGNAYSSTDLSRLDRMPKGAVFKSLYLSRTSVTRLPDDLVVMEDMHLNETSIRELPPNLIVGGTLHLKNSRITHIPDNLSAGKLVLQNSGVKTLGRDLKVGILVIDRALTNTEIQCSTLAIMNAMDTVFDLSNFKMETLDITEGKNSIQVLNVKAHALLYRGQQAFYHGGSNEFVSKKPISFCLNDSVFHSMDMFLTDNSRTQIHLGSGVTGSLLEVQVARQAYLQLSIDRAHIDDLILKSNQKVLVQIQIPELILFGNLNIQQTVNVNLPASGIVYGDVTASSESLTPGFQCVGNLTEIGLYPRSV